MELDFKSSDKAEVEETMRFDKSLQVYIHTHQCHIYNSFSCKFNHLFMYIYDMVVAGAEGTKVSDTQSCRIL